MLVVKVIMNNEQYWQKRAKEREEKWLNKEVGGMKGHMDTDGNMTHVCEQVEIDWKFADALQAAGVINTTNTFVEDD